MEVLDSKKKNSNLLGILGLFFTRIYLNFQFYLKSITWELPPGLGLPPEKIDDWWLAGGWGLIVGMGAGGLRAYFLGAGFGG